MRAREAVAQLMARRIARETAQALDVTPTTVRTHQYHAFEQLSMANVRALLLHRGPAGPGS